MRYVFPSIGLIGFTVAGLVGLVSSCSQKDPGQQRSAPSGSAQTPRPVVAQTSQQTLMPQVFNEDLFYVPIADSASLGPANALVSA